MGLYIILSSANNLQSDDTHSGRSFMNARKRISPRTEPWGTPDVTSASCDPAPSTMTFWDLPLRKLLIYRFTLPQVLFVQKTVMWDYIKGLGQTIIAMSICCPAEKPLASSSIKERVVFHMICTQSL